MKVARVVGKVSLSKVHPSLVGKRLVLAQPMGLKELTGRQDPVTPETVALDEIGAANDDWVGMADGAEAAMPFVPDKKPIDAYVACILEQLNINEELADRFLGSS